jgi:hypothetical protein
MGKTVHDLLKGLGADPGTGDDVYSLDIGPLGLTSIFGQPLSGNADVQVFSNEACHIQSPPELAAVGPIWASGLDSAKGLKSAIKDAHARLSKRLDEEQKKLKNWGGRPFLEGPDPVARATFKIEGIEAGIFLGPGGHLQLESLQSTPIEDSKEARAKLPKNASARDVMNALQELVEKYAHSLPSESSEADLDSDLGDLLDDSSIDGAPVSDDDLDLDDLLSADSEEGAPVEDDSDLDDLLSADSEEGAPASDDLDDLLGEDSDLGEPADPAQADAESEEIDLSFDSDFGDSPEEPAAGSDKGADEFDFDSDLDSISEEVRQISFSEDGPKPGAEEDEAATREYAQMLSDGEDPLAGLSSGSPSKVPDDGADSVEEKSTGELVHGFDPSSELPSTGLKNLAGLVGDGISSGKTGAIQLDAQTFAMLQQDLGHAPKDADEDTKEEIKALEEEAARHEAMAVELREKADRLRARLGEDAPSAFAPAPEKEKKRSLAARVEEMRKGRKNAEEDGALSDPKAAARAAAAALLSASGPAVEVSSESPPEEFDADSEEESVAKSDAKAVASALMGGSLPNIDVSMEADEIDADAMESEPSVEHPPDLDDVRDLDDKTRARSLAADLLESDEDEPWASLDDAPESAEAEEIVDDLDLSGAADSNGFEVSEENELDALAQEAANAAVSDGDDGDDDDLISPDLLAAAMADAEESAGEAKDENPEDDIEDMLSEMNLLVDVSVEEQVANSADAPPAEMGSADLMETRVQDEVLAALSEEFKLDDVSGSPVDSGVFKEDADMSLEEVDDFEALDSDEGEGEEDLSPSEEFRLGSEADDPIPSRDQMRIALVVGQARARERLKKRLAEHVAAIEEAASLSDAVELANAGDLHAMVVVRPSANAETRESITSLARMKKRPGVMILATDEKLADEDGVDMHLVMAQRASEVTQQILDGLDNLASRG